MSRQPLKICLVSAEAAPLAKTGGLADVAAALAAHVHGAGHDVRVLLPRYTHIDHLGLAIEPVEQLSDLTIRLGAQTLRYSVDRTQLPGTQVPVYLLRCPALYGRDEIYTQDPDEHLRFVLLSRVAFEMCRHLSFSPDILHSNDWHTGLLPLYLRTLYADDPLFKHTRSVLTIHNIGYQGVFPAAALAEVSVPGMESLLPQDDLQAGRINFLKTGAMYADLVTTVSPRYAQEIQTEQYGMGLEGLLRQRAGSVVGILNGVDYSTWDPAVDHLIPAPYSPDDLTGKTLCKHELLTRTGLDASSDIPLIGMVSRLVSQKGIDLIMATLPALLKDRDFSLIVLGSGEARYEAFFSAMQDQLPGRIAYANGYDEELAHWIEAGADMFLMPSLYEPCGLNQMYSLRYGTVPIVRETGGLADSVEHVDAATATGTGVVFKDYDTGGLTWAVNTALDLYQDRALWPVIMANGMARDFSWEQQGARYVQLFRELLAADARPGLTAGPIPDDAVI